MSKSSSHASATGTPPPPSPPPPLLRLPAETLLNVSRFLDVRSAFRLSTTCKTLAQKDAPPHRDLLASSAGLLHSHAHYAIVAAAKRQDHTAFADAVATVCRMSGRAGNDSSNDDILVLVEACSWILMVDLGLSGHEWWLPVYWLVEEVDHEIVDDDSEKVQRMAAVVVQACKRGHIKALESFTQVVCNPHPEFCCGQLDLACLIEDVCKRTLGDVQATWTQADFISVLTALAALFKRTTLYPRRHDCFESVELVTRSVVATGDIGIVVPVINVLYERLRDEQVCFRWLLDMLTDCCAVEHYALADLLLELYLVMIGDCGPSESNQPPTFDWGKHGDSTPADRHVTLKCVAAGATVDGLAEFQSILYLCPWQTVFVPWLLGILDWPECPRYVTQWMLSHAALNLSMIHHLPLAPARTRIGADFMNAETIALLLDQLPFDVPFHCDLTTAEHSSQLETWRSKACEGIGTRQPCPVVLGDLLQCTRCQVLTRTVSASPSRIPSVHAPFLARFIDTEWHVWFGPKPAHIRLGELNAISYLLRNASVPQPPASPDSASAQDSASRRFIAHHNRPLPAPPMGPRIPTVSFSASLSNWSTFFTSQVSAWPYDLRLSFSDSLLSHQIHCVHDPAHAPVVNYVSVVGALDVLYHVGEFEAMSFGLNELLGHCRSLPAAERDDILAVCRWPMTEDMLRELAALSLAFWTGATHDSAPMFPESLYMLDKAVQLGFVDAEMLERKEFRSLRLIRKQKKEPEGMMGKAAKEV